MKRFSKGQPFFRVRAWTGSVLLFALAIFAAACPYAVAALPALPVVPGTPEVPTKGAPTSQLPEVSVPSVSGSPVSVPHSAVPVTQSPPKIVGPITGAASGTASKAAREAGAGSGVAGAGAHTGTEAVDPASAGAVQTSSSSAQAESSFRSVAADPERRSRERSAGNGSERATRLTTLHQVFVHVWPAVALGGGALRSLLFDLGHAVDVNAPNFPASLANAILAGSSGKAGSPDTAPSGAHAGGSSTAGESIPLDNWVKGHGGLPIALFIVVLGGGIAAIGYTFRRELGAGPLWRRWHL